MVEHQDHPPANGRVHTDRGPQAEELLAQSLDPNLVSLRPGTDGRMVAYIEGYQVINQANRIFGYGRWGSEIIGPIGFRRLKPASADSAVAGIYSARVRVRASGHASRSDVGCGVVAEQTADAHETAMKAAVTDGMKRALRQFGDQFGNALYDRTDPSRLGAERELADLRAAVFALGALLGLDDVETRLQVSRRSGRGFEETGVRELASVLRSMVDALNRRRHAGPDAR
jgi:DNA recombination protein Rad52